MADFAAVDACPSCGDPVRRMPSRPGPWYCRRCIRDQLEFGRAVLVPYMVDVPTGDRL